MKIKNIVIGVTLVLLGFSGGCAALLYEREKMGSNLGMAEVHQEQHTTVRQHGMIVYEHHQETREVQPILPPGVSF